MKILSVMISFSVSFLLGFFLFSMVSTTPKDIRSQNTIINIEYMIQKYYQKNQTLPVKLFDLPLKYGSHRYLLDGWGNSLIYQINSNQSFTLICNGRTIPQSGIILQISKTINVCDLNE